MKKHVTILLLLAMLLSAFASCTGESTETETVGVAETVETVETEETETELTAKLPDMNYDGYEFTILTLNDYSNRIFWYVMK